MDSDKHEEIGNEIYLSEHGYLQPDVVLDWIRTSVMGVEM
jgi:hypothetical protein